MPLLKQTFEIVWSHLSTSQNRGARQSSQPSRSMAAAWPAGLSRPLFSCTSPRPRTTSWAGRDWYSGPIYTAFSLAILLPRPRTWRQTVLLPLFQEMGLAEIKPNDGGI